MTAVNQKSPDVGFVPPGVCWTLLCFSDSLAADIPLKFPVKKSCYLLNKFADHL